jgi:AcrR family transcriptional regulator
MALPRFEKLPAERRHRLLAAAAGEFAAKGFKGAALSAIAEKSEMGKTSFYYYFADKADLFATVLAEAWDRLRGESRMELERLTAESFWPEYEALARKNLELCRREPWLLDASKVLNRTSPEPADAALLDGYREKSRVWERAWIARGQELGVIRNDIPTDLLATISFSVDQATNQWLLDRVGEMGTEASGRLAFHVLESRRALLAPPQSG